MVCKGQYTNSVLVRKGSFGDREHLSRELPFNRGTMVYVHQN